MQMCRVADRWGATPCLRLCISALAKKFSRAPNDHPDPFLMHALADVMRVIIIRPPEHRAWAAKSEDIPSKADSPDLAAPLASALELLFGDVHALLTSPELLQLFRRAAAIPCGARVGSQ